MRWAGFQPAMRILCLLLFSAVAAGACASGPDEIVQLATIQANSPKPAYPAMSARLGEHGRVQMRVQVLASGDAGEVQLLQSSGYDRLDAAAVAGVKKFKFSPAQNRAGHAVDSWLNVPIAFHIDESSGASLIPR
jgi:TonB family protein